MRNPASESVLATIGPGSEVCLSTQMFRVWRMLWHPAASSCCVEGTVNRPTRWSTVVYGHRHGLCQCSLIISAVLWDLHAHRRRQQHVFSISPIICGVASSEMALPLLINNTREAAHAVTNSNGAIRRLRYNISWCFICLGTVGRAC